MQETEGKLNVFIDTSILEDCKYHLDYMPLQRVIEAEHIVLHTTSITINEIHERIKGQVGKHRQAIAEALKWMRSPTGDPAVWKDPDHFIEQYRTFCKHEHNGRGVDLGALVDLYIQGRAPFSTKKPDEFKDAIAALSLNHWAEIEDKNIYIVAKDPDWVNMCSTFSRFTHSTLGDLHAHLFRLDAMVAELDLDLVTRSLLGEKGKTELDAELGRIRPHVTNAKAMDVDSQFVDVSTISLQVRSQSIIGVEILVSASFSGSAAVTYRDETLEASIIGTLEVAVGVEYAFHRVNVNMWHVILPSEFPARVWNLSPNDQS